MFVADTSISTHTPTYLGFYNYSMDEIQSFSGI
jgi:hypothetical protein